MTVNTAAGAKIFIGGTDELTTQADYEAESWTEVGEAENLGEFGDEAATINFTALRDGRVRKFKGPRDAGTIDVVCGDDPNDTGQLAMVAAEQEIFDYNFRIDFNDAVTVGGAPSRFYFAGKVMSRRLNVGDVQNIVRRTFQVGINTSIIEVPAT